MQVYGTTGYLGECELSSIVSEQVANGRKEYSGPLAVKHVGLCRDGPQEATTNAKSRVYVGMGSLEVFSWLHELHR